MFPRFGSKVNTNCDRIDSRTVCLYWTADSTVWGNPAAHYCVERRNRSAITHTINRKDSPLGCLHLALAYRCRYINIIIIIMKICIIITIVIVVTVIIIIIIIIIIIYLYEGEMGLYLCALATV